MSREIKEADWKLFRQLHTVALERFSEQVLSEVHGISAQSTKSFHQRYLDIFKIIQTRDDDMCRLFDNPRRSTAFLQIAAIQSQGLLTDDEFQRFSEETRALIEVLLGSHRA